MKSAAYTSYRSTVCRSCSGWMAENREHFYPYLGNIRVGDWVRSSGRGKFYPDDCVGCSLVVKNNSGIDMLVLLIRLGVIGVGGERIRICYPPIEMFSLRSSVSVEDMRAMDDSFKNGKHDER